MPDAADKNEFIKWMAQHYMRRTTISESQAKQIAETTYENFITDENIQFGDSGYSWDEKTAHELVDLDLTYWED